MRTLFYFTSVLLVAALAFTGCKSNEKSADQHKVRLLALNVWQEGTSVANGVEKIADAILASDADIAAFSEIRNYKKVDWTTKLLDVLKKKAPGKTFYGQFGGGDVTLISRYPIESVVSVFDDAIPNDAGSLIAWRLTLPGDLKATVCAAHLDYRYFGLNLIRGYNGGSPDFKMIDADRDGEPDREQDADKILAYNRKSKRGPAIEAFLKFAAQEAAEGRQVILAGDFNEGSHLDWTGKAKDSFGHYGVALPWDNSIALHKAGFLDAYRVIYPDEVAHPGFTWPAIADGKKTTSWTPKSDERDRIDFIYYATASMKNFQVANAWVVGPKFYFINEEKTPYPGDEPFLCDDMPWPSDHNWVMAEFVW
ncbi:MAG: endonuclease/exonuclease/phosphatase family protein [Puniceicoccales bacterium]|jgi:hypothetical protein|nr:endonuclease/exonuclease/phosphatase family protein [Puniceicoccales bacterium]